MKVKRIVSALCCTALIAATAIPLAACGGAKELKKSEGEKLNLINYVEKYEKTRNDVSRDREIVTQGPINTASSSILSGPYIAVKANSSDSYYSIYNSKNFIKIIDNFEGSIGSTIGVTSRTVNYNTVYFPWTAKTTGEGDAAVTTYDVYSENGVKIATDANDISEVVITGGYYKVNTSSKASNEVWTVSYKSGENQVKNYFGVETDLSANRCKFLTAINESDINFVDSDYKAGETAFAAKQTLAEFIASRDGGKVRTLGADIADYTVTWVGSDWIFNKGEEEVFKIDYSFVDDIALVGNSIYYTEQILLSSDSGDADIIDASGPKDIKYTQELHKLNLVEKEDETLKVDAEILSLESAYNKTSDKYDALKINGYKLVDGVKQRDTRFTYFVNENFEIVLDATALGTATFSNLKELEGYIMYNSGGSYKFFNSDGTLKSEFKSDVNPQLYYTSKVIKFVKDGKIGFANYDGTIATEPIYTSSGNDVTLFNGNAYLTNEVTGKTVFVDVKNGTESEYKLGYKNDDNTYRCTYNLLTDNYGEYTGFYTKKEESRDDVSSTWGNTTWYIGTFGGSASSETQINGFTDSEFPSSAYRNSVWKFATNDAYGLYYVGYKY